MKLPESVKAEFKIKFESNDNAEMVLKSIEPELETSPSERSSVSACREDKTLHLVIQARDAPSLRASVNSYLRWIILSHDVGKIK